MSKIFQRNPNPSKNLEVDEFKNKHIKTTDVNILLNRVRLDKKKTFKKRLLATLIFVLSLSSVFAYMIIY
ncbi:hypothetical protein OA961_01795 [Candidatus Pelagibacter sp.]|nr:hypothetical protein [Candidatus Pelagibacter sp.]